MSTRACGRGEEDGPPPVDELTRDPPAIANLLVHDGTLSGDALPATVLDLAARGYLEIDVLGGGQHLYRLSPGVSWNDLEPYERRVLTLLHERAHRRTLPADRIGIGPDDDARAWWTEFGNEVVADAGARGYVRYGSEWPLSLGAFGIAALVVFILVVLGSGDASSTMRWIAFAAIFVLIIGGAQSLDLRSGADRALLSRAGRERRHWWHDARHVLGTDRELEDVPAGGIAVWNRYLAYAAALGLADDACRDLPIGPDGAHVAWVWRGDAWRRVRVRYPRWIPPGWGRPPLLVAGAAALTVAVTGWLLVSALRSERWHPAPPFADDVARVIGDFEPAIVAVALVLFAMGAWALVAAALDLARPCTVRDGTVVTRWVHQGHRWNPWGDLVPRAAFVVVDDGSSSVLRGLHVDPDAFDELRRGDRVRLTLTPNLGSIESISRLRARSR